MSDKALLTIRVTGRGCLVVLAGFVLLVALCGLTAPVWLPYPGQILQVETPLRPADAAIVLAGDLGERVDLAVELLEERWVDVLILSGGELNPYRSEATAAAHMRDLAIRRGVDPERVFLEERATSTMENALRSREILEDLDLDSALVVTSDFHARRAYYTFRQVFHGTGIELSIRSAPNPHFPLNRWWGSEMGLISIQNEWVRILWYLIRFRVVPWG